MVILDSTTLMLFFQPNAAPSTNPETKKPIEKCYERIELLINSLSKARVRVMIPTPVLAEILVAVGKDKAKILDEINGSSAFKVQSFDQNAAIEVALLTDADLQSGKRLKSPETKAKVKFDRQIIAIAKVNGVKTIYSDDIGLGKTARSNGISVIETRNLPLPQLPPQGELPL